MTSGLHIIKRSEWSLIAPLKPYFNIFPTKIIIHGYCFKTLHGKKETSKIFKGVKTLRYLQKKHIKQLGTIDIKYHFIIAPNGDIYEGRPIGTAGCHCKSQDNHSIGIMVFGNFNVEKPAREQIHSLLILLQYIKRKYTHMDIPKCIHNHCDLKLTLCPGHHLSNMVRIIKSKTNVDYN